MQPRFVRHILALTGALLAFGAVPAAAQETLPSAESILDRYIEVTGGREAYLHRQSEVMRGSVAFPSVGLQGTIERYSAPGLYYTSMNLAAMGTVEMGVVDGVAWERSDILGPRIKEGVERAEAIREAELNASLNWREQYPKVQTTGISEVNGERCYEVEMTPPEGHPQTTCYSIETGLALTTTTIATTQMGEVPSEVIVSEYKEFDGVLAPSLVTEKAAGQEVTISIQSAEANAEIPAGRFDLPSDVAELLAQQTPSPTPE